MKKTGSFIPTNLFTTMKKHVVPSSSTPLEKTSNNKHPIKRTVIRKHRHKKQHAAKHLFLNKVVSYLVSDSHMYNPLVSSQPSFDFSPPKQMFDSPGIQEDVVMPVKGRKKKLIEKVVDFLEADCYLYSPLVTNEHICSKSGATNNSGGQMQKESRVGDGGDLSSQLGARPVVKKTVASSYRESVKHIVH